MRCEHCGTLVEGSNGTCPLCGAPLAAQAPCFPPRQGRAHSIIVPFTALYWLVALLAMVAGGVCNAVFAPQVHYWAIGLAGVWYVYGLLRHTLLGAENWHHRLLRQTVYGLLLLVVVGLVVGAEVVFCWVMPIYYLACWVVNGAVALLEPRKANRYILSLWAQGLLAVAIIVLCVAQHLFWIPAVVCGGIGLVLCLVITLAHPREVWSQLKRTLDH